MCAQYSALCIVLSHFKLSETLDASNTFFFSYFKGHLPLLFFWSVGCYEKVKASSTEYSCETFSISQRLRYLMRWRVGSVRLCLQASVLRSVSILCNGTVDAVTQSCVCFVNSVCPAKLAKKTKIYSRLS